MSFNSELVSQILKYTNFSISHQGVTRYLKVPYYLGGKKSPQQIKDALLADSSIFTSSGGLKTASEIQAIMNSKKSTYGIDCSGFAYYVLNEASDGAVMDQFGLSYAHGVSAADMTKASNGTLKTRARDIVPGCTIGLTGHVMVVYSVDKDTYGRVIQINYRHSIYMASAPQDGVVAGFISIGDDIRDLNHSSQTWHDGYESGSVLKNIYTRTILLSSLTSLV